MVESKLHHGNNHESKPAKTKLKGTVHDHWTEESRSFKYLFKKDLFGPFLVLFVDAHYPLKPNQALELIC